jgi:hypothetical protein
MHPLGCNVYIIYGLCKKNLSILGLRVFFVWKYLVFRWGLKFSICSTIPYHPMSDPKCMPQPQIAILR